MKYPEISEAELATLKIKQTFSTHPDSRLDWSVKLGELHSLRRSMLSYNKQQSSPLFHYPIEDIDKAISEVEENLDASNIP